ncbi:hypothetical protein J1N35_044235, partial [Gossypium stocksii]
FIQFSPMARIKTASKTIESSRVGAAQPKRSFNADVTTRYNNDIVKSHFYFGTRVLF